MRDARGLEQRPHRRADAVAVEPGSDRLQRFHRLLQGRVLVQWPALLDEDPELVELRVDDHHVALNPEVRRPQDLGPGRGRDAQGELRAQGGDLRRLRQLGELARGGVERLLVPEHPFGARCATLRAGRV